MLSDFFVFFKQKTAYEMRISDWSSDVCSSDLTYATLADLMATYERLRDKGIRPVFPINHGPTTSMYYADPDGNQIELQVDNYDKIEDATAFFYSEAFAENPVGVEFDPDELLRRLRAGEPEEDLKRRPDVGKRGLADIKLR